MSSNSDIAEALRTMNETRNAGTARAVGFRSWFDDAIDGSEVSVLWELETPAGRTWPLQRTDELCRLAAEALAPLGIVNVYCAYRTGADPADEGDFVHWRALEAKAA